MSRRWPVFLLPTALPAAAVLAVAAFAAEIPQASYMEHVRYLASDELNGRGTGTPELEKAADYIAAEFAKYGVQPVPGHGYKQPFTARIGSRLDRDNRLTYTSGGRSQTLALRSGFIPFSFSSTGALQPTQVVFAGYGITAPEYNYDDYAGLDVKDKLVLILRHEPQETDAKSAWNGRETTKHATFVNKAINAKQHGAKGAILINDIYTHPGERDALLAFGSAEGPSDVGVYYVQISASTAEQWIKAANRDLRGIISTIDRELKPQSFALNNVTVAMNVAITHEAKTVHNVAAYIPGTTDEHIVIGAHYDHLGLGDEHSLAPREIGKIHHGADDNASGTAGVLELARWFAKQPKPRRGILFITFSGEELGLLGSSYYTNNPLLPLEKAAAMLNMDMIGRIRDGKIYVNGTGTGNTLTKLVESIPVPSPLKVDFSESTGYGGSDHISFEAKQVPVIFFFSGLHADYHKPSDTADKIQAPAAAALLGYVADIATAIANAPERPQFSRTARPQPQGDPHSGDAGPVSSGYGAYFGSVPDFNEPPKGVRFADVREGSPAGKAGLKAGDILIEFDGKEIANLYDFTYALQSHKPGEEVPVKYLRGSQIFEAKVLLTERP